MAVEVAGVDEGEFGVVVGTVFLVDGGFVTADSADFEGGGLCGVIVGVVDEVHAVDVAIACAVFVSSATGCALGAL